MIRTLLFVLAVAVVTAEDAVVNLEGQETFKTWVEEQSITVVEFYAPWCGHCKKLLPEFEEAAGQLAEDNIKLGKVDCTADDNKDLCQEFGVSGYPTIKYFKSGEAGDYKGGRTSADILGFVRARSGPPVSELENVEDAKKFQKRGSLVMIEFAEKLSEPFEKSANALLEKFSFGSVKDKAIAKELGAEFPSVTLFRDFDEPIVKFEGKVGSKEFTEWVNAESLPVFGEIGPGNYQAYMDRGLPLAWVAVTPGEDDDLLKELTPVAAEHRGKISVVSIDGVKFDGHLKKLGLTGDLPGVILTDGNLKYNTDKKLNKESLAEFLSSFAAGSLEAFMKSEEIPEDNSSPLKVIVGKTFKEYTESGKDVLLEFYAPWCGHCKKLAPIYEELAENHADNENLVIAKIDATENDTDVEVRGFPTIMLFSPSFDEPLTFKGERTLEGFEKWLKQNAPSLKGKDSHDEL